MSREFLKERDGDNLGDGNISEIPKMGNSLKERDGDISGVIWKIENITILKEREGDNLGITKMGMF